MSFDTELTTNLYTEDAIRELRRKLGLVFYFGKLGDNDGEGVEEATIDEPGSPGLVRVRIEGDTSVPYRVIKSGVIGPYQVYPGSPVVIGYDEKNELSIKWADHDALQELPTANPLILNTGDTRVAASLQTDSLLPLWCGAVATTTTASTKVLVNPFRYVDNADTVHYYEGGQVELASYIPTAGNHRYVALFLKDDDTIAVFGSTAQDLSIPLDDTDKQEIFDSRPTNSFPIWLWRLHDAQSTINSSDKVEDLRGWLSVPKDRTTVIGKVRTIGPTYTVQGSDTEIFANTDSNAVTVNLPAGEDNRHITIKNTGISQNNVTIVPNGSEKLIGYNLSFVLFDGENLIITYDTTDGWF